MPDDVRRGTEDRGQKPCRGDAAQARQPARSADKNQSPVLSPQSSETLLAFDFGIRRIGVAVGNTLLRRASPLTTIDEEKTDVRFTKIGALLDEWKPNALVVGLPSNDDSTPHELTALCRRFANRLKGRFNLPTILVDERYTSHTASAQLNEQGVHGKKQKPLIDQYAAQQILQAYFDEPAAGLIV